MWQDWLLASGNLIFVAVLIPSLRNRHTELCRITSVTTAAVMFAFAFTHLTMDMPLAASMNAAGAVVWSLLALLRPIREYEEIEVAIPQFEVTQDEAELILAHREWMVEQARRRRGEPEPGEEPSACDGCPSQAPSGGG